MAVSEAEGSIPAPSKDRTAATVACIFPDIDDILSTVSDEIFGEHSNRLGLNFNLLYC